MGVKQGGGGTKHRERQATRTLKPAAAATVAEIADFNLCYQATYGHEATGEVPAEAAAPLSPGWRPSAGA